MEIAKLAGALALLAGTVSAEPFKDGDTVVFFGDSITHGGFYHEYVTDFYRTRYPEAKIRFVNSGIGGDTAKGALTRIAVDVAEYDPTWVGFHFGMNDIDRGAYTATPSPWQLIRADAAQKGYRRNLDALVAAVRKAVPGAKHVYFTPTIYDDTAVPTNVPSGATGWAVVNQVGCNAGLGLMAGHVLAAAKRDGALAVDWYTPLERWLMARRPKDPHYMLTRWDRVHPEALGHAIMAWCFLKAQGVPATVSDVALDAAVGTVTRCENATADEVARTADGIACTVLAKSLPFPVPPEARVALGKFAVEETLNREVFAVSGLEDGVYALCIDGAEVARADAATLAKGLRLGFNEKTPQYRQAQAFFAHNAELARRERMLRNSHSARWAYGGRGAPVDDMKAFAAWFEENEKDKTGYFAGFVPGYLEYWPHYRETRERLWSDQEKARKMVSPVAHRYVVKRVAE
ncbi:MAG: SGNH/GDSL hydrolase family protein [Kiritimatiellae bacterium]|nr:SGNH/GDSL hydrolase family protein [Kiritimatiellia bacterium]